MDTNGEMGRSPETTDSSERREGVGYVTEKIRKKAGHHISADVTDVTLSLSNWMFEALRHVFESMCCSR